MIVRHHPNYNRNEQKMTNQTPTDPDTWKLDDITSPGMARDAAVTWQHWQSEQGMSWGKVAEWRAFFTELAERFPELADEFRENGIA